MDVDFSCRNKLTELMDSDETDFETFRACLLDLAKVNRLTRAYRPTLAFLERLRRSGRLAPGGTRRLLDVGCGSGDMLRKIDLWAQKRGLDIELVGIDLNPWSALTAKEFASPGRPIRFLAANAFDYRPSEPSDVIISSLFTHHLDDAAIIEFVLWMEREARLGWFVNDLRRHALPYHAFRFAARALALHPFVQHDGPVSIARAFSPEDWRALAARAGVVAEIRRHFPFRLCVSRIKADSR
ncbi:MAG TPA: methyltransferase domain-containing protein [Methylovirgula sp.]|nr:methyltransferase domain-containing protein [Methylovirgula sp.]